MSKTQEERRKKSNNKIKESGIACLETLPLVEDSSEVHLKSLDAICKRCIACLLSTQLACDIEEESDYEESKKLFTSLLEGYHVKDALLKKEQKLFDGTYTKQDAVDVAWTYEAYWSLVWALGLVPDITYPYEICDCQKAITLVGDCESFDAFKKQCHLKDVEKILDMIDLYYRYHWACVEKRINPETSIGKLNPDVVVERRRGLEWLISEEADWNEISLDT